MWFRGLCFYATALLPLFIAGSVQAGPVGLAHREVMGRNEHRDIYKRGKNWYGTYLTTVVNLHRRSIHRS